MWRCMLLIIVLLAEQGRKEAAALITLVRRASLVAGLLHARTLARAHLTARSSARHALAHAVSMPATAILSHHFLLVFTQSDDVHVVRRRTIDQGIPRRAP